MMKWIVTGGAGFIGCNTVKRLLDLGYDVVLIDDLSRTGAQMNLEWLRSKGHFDFVKQDIRDFAGLCDSISRHSDVDVVLHLAAQVAVTTSIVDPRKDFEINALGTFNLLEALRQSKGDPTFLYASTNKVYGQMQHVDTELRDGRYQYIDLPQGIDESAPLDFHSPYGCSKGAADQYVRDYARIYGLKTVVLRQSCIYGPRQFGLEDQGWVAWFTIASVLGSPITIYGDGRQVRDVLYIDDLVDFYLKAIEHISRTNGKVYNIGGGSENQLSLLDLLSILESKLGHPIEISYDVWRPGDQHVFMDDITKAQLECNWRPNFSIISGLDYLYEWVCEHQDLLKSVLGELL